MSRPIQPPTPEELDDAHAHAYYEARARQLMATSPACQSRGPYDLGLARFLAHTIYGSDNEEPGHVPGPIPRQHVARI